jgi:cysteinyl-tRNA synthetase
VEYLYETVAAARAFLKQAPTKPDAVQAKDLADKFAAAMDDDFNTAVAMAQLIYEARGVNEALALKNKDPKKAPTVATLRAAIEDQGEVLGLSRRDPAETIAAIQAMKLARSGLDRARIEGLVADRTAARQARDFARSDAIRDELLGLGVQLMDGPDGTRWKLS